MASEIMPTDDDDDDGVLDAADAFPLISVLGLLTPMVMVAQMSATRTASIWA